MRLSSTGNGDRFVLDLVKRSEKPALLLLNKIDKLEDKVCVAAVDGVVSEGVRLAGDRSDLSSEERNDRRARSKAVCVICPKANRYFPKMS